MAQTRGQMPDAYGNFKPMKKSLDNKKDAIPGLQAARMNLKQGRAATLPKKMRAGGKRGC